MEEDGRHGKYMRSGAVVSGGLCCVTTVLPSLHRQVRHHYPELVSQVTRGKEQPAFCPYELSGVL